MLSLILKLKLIFMYLVINILLPLLQNEVSKIKHFMNFTNNIMHLLIYLDYYFVKI